MNGIHPINKNRNQNTLLSFVRFISKLSVDDSGYFTSMRTLRFFFLEELADDERLILIKIPIATIKTTGITTDIIIIISFFDGSSPFSFPNVVALIAIQVDAVVVAVGTCTFYQIIETNVKILFLPWLF